MLTALRASLQGQRDRGDNSLEWTIGLRVGPVTTGTRMDDGAAQSRAVGASGVR